MDHMKRITTIQRAIDWLSNLDWSQPRTFKGLAELGASVGFTAITIRRAVDRLPIMADMDKDDQGRFTSWTLRWVAS